MFCGYCGAPHGGDCTERPTVECELCGRHDHTADNAMWGPVDCPAILDLEKVAHLIRRRGHRAEVEQTGGGVATVYVGRSFNASDEICEGYTYEEVLIGPGWFTRGGYDGHGAGAVFLRDGDPWRPRAAAGFASPRGMVGDLSIGTDQYSDEWEYVPEGADEATVADLAVRLVERVRAEDLAAGYTVVGGDDPTDERRNG